MRKQATNDVLAELCQQTSGEVTQRPMIVDVRTQAQLSADDTRRDSGYELVQLKSRQHACKYRHRTRVTDDIDIDNTYK